MRTRVLPLVAVLVLTAAPPARAGGPTMLIGAAEDNVKQPTLTGAKAQMDLLVLAGFNAVRITQVWAPDDTKPAVADLRILKNVAEAARLAGVQVLLMVTNFGSRTTPLTEEARGQFAAYAAALARVLPSVDDFIVGNEPNLNRYWLPQFNPDGSDAAAPAYEALLAQTYDALKAVSRKLVVIGGAVSPHGGDDPTSTRQTHSPSTFIPDMGAAYRASNRTRPIMDAFAFHPYEDNSSIAPVDGIHPSSTTIALADYDKLVAGLGKAFDGTAQPGSKLPIYYDEFGIESQIPPAKQQLYTGTELPAVKAVPEQTQGAYYRQAVQLAFCQPTVRGLFIFHTVDERDLNRWQSGLFYVDGKPKSDLPVVRVAIAQAHRGVVARCPGLALRPRTSGLRTSEAPHPALTLTCDIDCLYSLSVRRGADEVRRVRGRAIGGLPRRIALERLRPGTYSLRVTLTAPVNPGPPRTEAAPRLVVP